MAIKPIEILINAKDNASSVFSSLQGKVAAVGAAIAAYFGVSAFVGVVKGAADLEAGMSRVQAATGASAEEMAKLRKAAEDAGANTKFTSTEAAAALENLAKAGLSANDSIAALPAVLQLAQAGDIELATASEFVTKAVMGMGLAFSDAGRVADVLALGANATNTSVTGLAQALSYAAPVAQSLGLSLESTVAIIGKFADAGIDASRAGTALNSILSQFANPASKFREELASAGITTGNFEGALRQLAAAGPAGSKAINAVGQEAGPALRALLNQGMGALDELTGKLKNAEGSAAATAKAMQDNLNGSLNGLSSAWDTLKNALGTPVLPVLKDGVDQLAGALKSAVADGTIGKFGEAIATAFQAGIKWAKEFIGQVDFNQLTTDLRAFADRAGEVFDQVGEYATNAGNSVKLAYGVMSAGVNTVLTAVYGIGSVFSEVASTVMSGVAKLRDGLASVTFGKLSESFKLAADDARNMAQGFGEAAQAMRDKASQSFDDVASAAQTARNGFAGLVGAVEAAAPAADTASKAIADMASQIEAAGKKTEAAKAATDSKAESDKAAAQAIATLRAEYADLVANGDLQAAAVKITEINKALAGTASASKDAARAAADAAAQIEAAFDRLGVTSSEALKRTAENAQRDYTTIKNAGTSTAEDIAGAFKIAADKAIAANKGIAPSWVEAEAASRGYEVQVDAAGKSTLKLRDSIEAVGTASGRVAPGMQRDWGGVTSAINTTNQALQEYQQRMKEKYGRPGEGDKGLFDRDRVSTRGEDLAPGVQEIGTGGYQFRNKDGMTSDAKGNVQQQWVWTRATIIDYLEQAGLDKMLSEDLAKQFVQPDGSVNYKASAAQKQWGGQFSTLSEALGKMVDFYKYGDGKHEAQQRTAFLNGGNQPPAPTAPAASERPSAFGNPTTTVNITLDGSTRAINTDAAGADALQELLRQLTTAKSVAAR